MRKKTTPNELETRICPICNEGHIKGKKWIYTPNKFLPFDLPDGTPVCMKHYATEHSKWRFQNKIKGNIEYAETRRKKDNERYREDSEYRNNVLEKRKNYIIRHSEEIKERKKLYSQTEEGKEASRIRNRRFYENNREKQKQRQKDLATQANRQFFYLKRRAFKSNIECNLTIEEFNEIKSKMVCYYCQEELSKTAPGLDRLDSTKGYSKKNCVACCKRCNTIKRDLVQPEELLMFNKILKNEIEIPEIENLYSLYKQPEKISKVKKRWGRLKKATNSKGINLDLTFEQYKEILKQPCEYCGVENLGTGYGLDKKIPDKDIGYTFENSVSCCTPCNQIKNNYLTHEEMKILMKVISYNRKGLVNEPPIN
jgi:hypothetical protein